MVDEDLDDAFVSVERRQVERRQFVSVADVGTAAGHAGEKPLPANRSHRRRKLRRKRLLVTMRWWGRRRRRMTLSRQRGSRFEAAVVAAAAATRFRVGRFSRRAAAPSPAFVGGSLFQF